MQSGRVIHLALISFHVSELEDPIYARTEEIGPTLKRFMKLSTPPISSPTSFIRDLYCASSLIHAGAYLRVSIGLHRIPEGEGRHRLCHKRSHETPGLTLYP